MPKPTPGRALYGAYSSTFAYRHPLPWGALHEHERGLWAQLEGDATAAKPRTFVGIADLEAAAGALTKSESAEAVGLDGAVMAEYLHENLWLADQLEHRNKVGCLIYGMALGILSERHKATGQIVPDPTGERVTVPA